MSHGDFGSSDSSCTMPSEYKWGCKDATLCHSKSNRRKCILVIKGQNIVNCAERKP